MGGSTLKGVSKILTKYFREKNLIFYIKLLIYLEYLLYSHKKAINFKKVLFFIKL